MVDKSLLVTDGSGRYRLLQTLAQYGRERLVARDDNEAVRDRHAEYYRVLAERSWVDWRQPGGRPQTWWIGHLTDELDNLRAALTWSIGRPDAEHGTAARRITGVLLVEQRPDGGRPRLARTGARLPRATSSARAHGLAIAWDAFLAIKAGRVDTALGPDLRGARRRRRDR